MNPIFSLPRLFFSGSLEPHIRTAVGNTSLASLSRTDGEVVERGREIWGKLVEYKRGLGGEARRHYARTTVVGPRTRVTDEVSGGTADLSLAHVRVARDVTLAADKGGPLVFSADIFSDLKRHHKLAFESKLLGINGSFLSAFSSCDWAPGAGFGPSTRALSWSQRLHSCLVVVTRGTANKSLKQLTIQPILKAGKQHEVSAIMSATWRSHFEGGFNYKFLLHEGQQGEEEMIQLRMLFHKGHNGARSQSFFQIKAKIGAEVE